MTINVFSVIAPSEDPNIIQSYKDFESKDYTMISDYEMKHKSYSSLRDIAIPYSLKYSAINLSKLKCDCGFDSMPYVLQSSDECIVFTDGVKKSVIGIRKMEEEYYYERIGTFWAFKLTPLATWLQEQSFQKYLKDTFVKQGISIFKEGYYKLDNNQIGLIDVFDGFTHSLSNYREEFLVYNET